jgi:hypothetical protein
MTRLYNSGVDFARPLGLMSCGGWFGQFASLLRGGNVLKLPV